MNLVFFTHPDFLNHQSMRRFTEMLAEGMIKRGHQVHFWAPQAKFFNMPSPSSTKKWLGYIDQFIVFPQTVRNRLYSCPSNTLFVFTDQALGPWVPLVADRPNVIHTHDFMAQRSALGEIQENSTKWTGRIYQSYIRKGYSKGKNFIPISEKTKEDLLRFLRNDGVSIEMVHNGMHQLCEPQESANARCQLGAKIGLDLNSGFLLHVGGNAWYKNRSGVIEIYNAWRSHYNEELPLLLIGQKPDHRLLEIAEASPYKESIHFLPDIDDDHVQIAYNGASVFLFPSLAEGFGWPIAEAMASGCPVITTNEAPMTEVAGDAGFLIPRKPLNDSTQWAAMAASVVNDIITLDPIKRKKITARGIRNVERFNPKIFLDKIESIYTNILQSHSAS